MKPVEEQTQIILDSIADGVFTVDSQWRITSFNKAAENITGIRKEEALHRHCWEVFKANICKQHCQLRQTLKTGKPFVSQSIFIVNVSGDRIPVSISTALLRDKDGQVIGGVESFRDLSVIEALRKELAGKHSFQDIISKNKEMQHLFGMLELVSENNTTILLEGESGTGKELFAKAIHSLSPRKHGPMITLNCGSLPDTLFEAELFGYKAGAFTDAKKDKPGRLALADGGTLFLDEIGDLSPALQVKMLRVLQEKVYEPLGSIRTEHADVRIVGATNKNLEDLVRKEAFRQDLYYRINVVRLSLPPLRNRKEDIPLLSEHFIIKFNRLNNKTIPPQLSPEALSVLMSHDFPGNVRELENIIEYATIVCKNKQIHETHLPKYLFENSSPPLTPCIENHFSEHPSLAELERNFIYESLRKNNWNRKQTAMQMKIHPSTLWRKIRHLGIELPKADGRSKL